MILIILFSTVPVVDHTIRYHFNLNVSAYLNNYPGPVLLVRRLQDEIISIDFQNRVETNCGNQILEKLLAARYPILMADRDIQKHLKTWLNSPANQGSQRAITEQMYRAPDAMAPIKRFIDENDVKQYPVLIEPEGIAKETIYCLVSDHFASYLRLPLLILSYPTGCTDDEKLQLYPLYTASCLILQRAHEYVPAVEDFSLHCYLVLISLLFFLPYFLLSHAV